MAHCEIRKPAASQFLRIFFRCQQQANSFSSRLPSSLPSPHRIGSGQQHHDCAEAAVPKLQALLTVPDQGYSHGYHSGSASCSISRC